MMVLYMQHSYTSRIRSALIRPLPSTAHQTYSIRILEVRLITLSFSFSKNITLYQPIAIGLLQAFESEYIPVPAGLLR